MALTENRLCRSVLPIALTALAMVAMAPAAAQDYQGGLAAQGQAARDEHYDFDIPAQPLSNALGAFGRQSGLQVTVDASVTANLQAPAVTGNLTADEALERLLAGSGIAWQIGDDGTVLLTGVENSGAVVLDVVRVEEAALSSSGVIDDLPAPYAGGQVADGGQLGILGNTDVMDAPFSITSYTADLIESRQATTLADALASDPSVRVDIQGRGTNNGGGDQFIIRGFRFPNSDVSLNGLYGVLPAGTISVETVERVEVLRGPSALLNGMAPSGGVGGAVNIVPKRAGEDPLTRFTGTYASDAQIGGHLDVGRRFGEGDAFGVRFNGIYRDGDTAIDDQENKLGVATLALDYQGEAFRSTIDMGYQYDRTDVPGSWGGGLRLLPAVTEIPDAPEADARTAQLWEYASSEDVYGVIQAEYDILPNLMLYGGFGARHNEQENLRTSSRLVDDTGLLASQPANYPQYLDTISGEAGLRGVVSTGTLNHEWNVGFSRYFQEVGFGFTAFAVSPSNLYSIADIAEPNSATFAEANKSSEMTLTSFAVSDTLIVADDLARLTLGIRRQEVSVENFNVATGASTSSYDEHAFTPALGLVVRPWQHLSFYGNYIQGLSPGATAPAGTLNAGQTFPPIKTEQIEAGVKLDLGEFGATFSVFRITQPNGITVPGPTPATTIFTVDGEQENSGAELAVFGELDPGLRLLGGVTFLDAVQTKTLGGLNDGKTAVGVPHWMANVGIEWDAGFAEGLTFNALTILTGSQYADVTNRLTVPGWGRLDLGASYEPEAWPVELRASVLNVFDRDYWASVASPTGLRLGAPRTALLSVSMDF